MPTVDGPRAHLIAALHILINWLIDHPDAPVPSEIRVTGWDRRLQTADLQELAESLQGEYKRVEDTAQWAAVPVPVGDQGVKAEYVCFGAHLSGE